MGSRHCRSVPGRTYRARASRAGLRACVGHPHGTQLYILGADGQLGNDEFLRLLYGARVSLEVAVLSTLGSW